MKDSQISSQATRSHDAVIGRFLEELDNARDEDTIANLLARAIASDPRGPMSSAPWPPGSRTCAACATRSG